MGMKSFQEIEKAAFQNLPLPKYSNQIENAAYLALRSIYQDYRKRYLKKDEAKTERDRVKRYYQTESENYQNYLEGSRYLNAIRVSVSIVGKEMAQNGCPLCKRFLNAIDGRI